MFQAFRAGRAERWEGVPGIYPIASDLYAYISASSRSESAREEFSRSLDALEVLLRDVSQLVRDAIGIEILGRMIYDLALLKIVDQHQGPLLREALAEKRRAIEAWQTNDREYIELQRRLLKAVEDGSGFDS